MRVIPILTVTIIIPAPLTPATILLLLVQPVLILINLTQLIVRLAKPGEDVVAVSVILPKLAV